MAYREARTTILQRFNGTAIVDRKMILVFFYMLSPFRSDALRTPPLLELDCLRYGGYT